MIWLSIYPTSSNLIIDSSLASDLRLVCDHQPSVRSNGSARSVQGIGCPPKAKGPVEAARCEEGLVSQNRTQPASHRVTRPRGKRLVALVEEVLHRLRFQRPESESHAFVLSASIHLADSWNPVRSSSWHPKGSDLAATSYVTPRFRWPTDF